MSVGADHVDDEGSPESTDEQPWWASIDHPPEIRLDQPEDHAGLSRAEGAQTESPSPAEILSGTDTSMTSESASDESSNGNAPLAPVVLSPVDGATRGPGELAFDGMADAGCTVRLLDWAQPVAETLVEPGGHWRVRLPEVNVGDHMYAALCVDAQGLQSPTCRPFLIQVRKDPTLYAGTVPALTPAQPEQVPASSAVEDQVKPVESRETEQFSGQKSAPTQESGASGVLSPVTDGEPAKPDSDELLLLAGEERTANLETTDGEDQSPRFNQRTEPPPAASVDEIEKASDSDYSGVFAGHDNDLDPVVHPTDATAPPAEPEPGVGSGGSSSTTESLLNSLPHPSASPALPYPESREVSDSHLRLSTTTARGLPLDSILITALILVLAGTAVLLYQSRFGAKTPVTSSALSAGLTRPAGHAPAPRKAWHFAPPTKGARKVVITLYNAGQSHKTTLVMTRTHTVWRVRIPPKSEAEAVLPRSSRRQPLTIDASGPVVAWRTTVRRHGFVRSYGIAGP